MERSAMDLAARLAAYHPAPDPLLDTRPQLFSELRGVANELQFLRTQELPSYLATTPHDAYVSELLKSLFAESGIAEVHPVASLHQASWFATAANPPSHPLMLAPIQVVFDAGEIPLFFHETGHVLYRLWGQAFHRHLGASMARTVDGLRRDASNRSDPTDRKARYDLVRGWERLAYRQLEEVACDLVGALVGGPSFVVALHIALLIPSTTPFEQTMPNYPPLDVRMHLATAGLRRLGIAHCWMSITIAAHVNQNCRF